MKYIRQLAWILLFSCFGELCRFLIPYPIPASVYGMVLMFVALATHVLPLEEVRDAGTFLVSFMPVLFVAPTVNIIACWDAIKGDIFPIVLVIVISTVITFGASGLVTQWFIRRRKGGENRA